MPQYTNIQLSGTHVKHPTKKNIVNVNKSYMRDNCHLPDKVITTEERCVFDLRIFSFQAVDEAMNPKIHMPAKW